VPLWHGFKLGKKNAVVKKQQKQRLANKFIFLVAILPTTG
jgi:hypothetical protein